MTKFFLDCEFYNDGDTIDLASLGIVAEDGTGAYWESKEFNGGIVSPWVATHVLPLLGKVEQKLRHTIAYELVKFITAHSRDLNDTPQFYGDCCGFDMVCLSQLFGTFDEWPRNWPFFMHDIRTLESWTNILLPALDGTHHALDDAFAIKSQFDYLMATLEGQRRIEELGADVAGAGSTAPYRISTPNPWPEGQPAQV